MLPEATPAVPRAPSTVQIKRRIFIGSSAEGIDRAKQVAQLLASDTIECRLWNTVFEPGYLTFETLEQMLLECCAAVFIATPDDKSTIRGREVSVPRANIMLEFGLVAGRLGRHNIAICRYGGTELPSDLKALTVIEMEPGVETLRGVPANYLDEFKHHAEQALVAWASRLLPTAEMIPRTDTVHGYTGRWTFDIRLDHWRGVQVSQLSYAEGNGSIELYVDATGKTGHGCVYGHLTFKLANDRDATQPPFQGELRFCHEITNLVCDPTGGVRFTSRTFTIQKLTTAGSPIAEIGTLNDLPEPWPFQWELQPTSEPRTLGGTIAAENPGQTTGVVRIMKAEYV